MEPEVVERTKSFSFSCHDFKTSVAVFSDGEESCSDESYIEIAIGPTSTDGFDERKKDPADDGVQREHKKELDLRISFSSSFPLPELSKTDVLGRIGCGSDTGTSLSSSTTSSSKSTFGPSSSAEAKYWTAPLGRSPSNKFNKTLKRKLQFPAVNRFLDNLMSNSRGQSEVREKSGGRYSPAVATETNQLDHVQGRKTSNIKNRSSRGVIMKFFMKFKSKNFQALLASMVKPQQFGDYGVKKTRSEEILERNWGQVTPWNRSLVQMEKGKNRGFEIKMDAIQRVMESMSTSFGRNDRKTRSCPGSAKSSPIHHGYTTESKVMCRDSSIQAAIAHCKRSLGQTSDL
ncbi:hypothetical protein SLEP1_g16456 [Rubroshorea leprosula]|uniref:Uncharacterized protein n=1 Tax=Rubroshorea leprosula TaxID=152421 RepID=A0AAV5J071_9ROSI|nr:hypothetical protein SLEP1_g16456 [Rubroshorea leprosula]